MYAAELRTTIAHIVGIASQKASGNYTYVAKIAGQKIIQLHKQDSLSIR